MRNTKKLVCLVMALLMVFFAFASCQKKEQASNAEKFLSTNFYKPEDKLNIVPLVSTNNLNDVVDKYKDKNVDMDFSLEANKIEVNGEDYLQMIGGPVSIKIEDLIVEKDGKFSLPIAVSLKGFTVNASLSFDGECIYVNIPLFLEKPLAINVGMFQQLQASADDYADSKENLDMIIGITEKFGTLEEELESVIKEVFTKENLDKVIKRLADCIPDSAIKKENVKLDDFKAGYISYVDTECYTFTITEEIFCTLVENIVKKFGDSEECKAGFAKVYDVLKKTGVFDDTEVADLDGNAVYDKLFDELEEVLGVFEGSEVAESEDETGESVEATSGESEDDAENAIVIKRYFAGDVSVKTSVMFDENEEVSIWDVVVGNKNEYGFKYSVSREYGSNSVDVICGADDTKATGTVNVTSTYDYHGTDRKDTNTTEVTYEKTAKTFKLNAKNVDNEDTQFEASVNYTETDAGMTFNATADIKGNEYELNITETKVDTTTKYDITLKGDDIDIQLAASYGIAPTDKTATIPNKSDCEVIDTTDALEQLIGGLFGSVDIGGGFLEV